MIGFLGRIVFWPLRLVLGWWVRASWGSRVTGLMAAFVLWVGFQSTWAGLAVAVGWFGFQRWRLTRAQRKVQAFAGVPSPWESEPQSDGGQASASAQPMASWGNMLSPSASQGRSVASSHSVARPPAGPSSSGAPPKSSKPSIPDWLVPSEGGKTKRSRFR